MQSNNHRFLRTALSVLIVSCAAPAPPPAAPPEPATAPPAPTTVASEQAPPSSFAPVPASPAHITVTLEDVPSSSGKHEVFAVAKELSLRQKIVDYEDPGACVMGSPVSARSSRAHRDFLMPAAQEEPVQEAVHLSCGLDGRASVKIGATLTELVLGSQRIPFPPGAKIALPHEAPLPQGVLPCSEKTKVSTIQGITVVHPKKDPDQSDVRVLSLQIPGIAPISFIEISGYDDCNSVISDKRNWLKISCRNGIRWERYSEKSAMIYQQGDKLLIESHFSSTDSTNSARQVLQLPCGTKVTASGLTVPNKHPRAPAGCPGRCHLPEGPCEDRCLAKFGTEHGPSRSEEEDKCEQACRDAAQSCETRCYR